jgi:hypothetical protein
MRIGCVLLFLLICINPKQRNAVRAKANQQAAYRRGSHDAVQERNIAVIAAECARAHF